MNMGHLTEVEAEAMKRGELTSAERLHALQHLATCASCRENIPFDDAAMRRFEQSVYAESEPHLDLDTQLIPFVDGSLDAADREIVEAHLEDCAMCRAEAEDLQRLRAQRNVRRHTPRPARLAAILAFAAAAAVVLVFMTMRREPPATTTPRVAPPVVAVPAPAPMRPEWRSLMETALTTGTLPFPNDLAALRPTVDAPRGTGQQSEERFAPAGIVVDDTTPEFSWPARDRATYVVAVYDGDREVLRSASLRESRWLATKPLQRGRTYAWQVEVTFANDTTDILPAPPAPPALFRITTEETHAELAEAKRQHPDDALLLAVLYARAGLKGEALDALARASATDPRVRTLLHHHSRN